MESIAPIHEGIEGLRNSPSESDTALPMDSLRQTFFDDLDEASRVNPNRVRPSNGPTSMSERERHVLETLRVSILEQLGPHPSPSAHDIVPQASWGGHSKTPEPTREKSNRANALSLRQSRTDHRLYEGHDGIPQPPLARGSCAILTNIIAGSLTGVALHRITSIAAANVAAGIVCTQLLCWMGYASVQWGALRRDLCRIILYGYQKDPAEEEEPNQLMQKWQEFMGTLTATVPRRLSFWSGVAAGVLLI